MAIERGVNLKEPGDIETLNLATLDCHSWNDIEYVRIGVLEEDARGPNGTVSFQLVQFDRDHIAGAKSLQANLTLAEIDIVIEGLQEAKRRMEAINAGA